MTSILQNIFKISSSFVNSLVKTPALNSQRRVSSLSKLVDSTTTTSTILQQFNQLLRTGERSMSNVLLKMHLRGPHKKTRPSTNPLNGAPMLKGVVLKTLIRKPKKPNSANRKCVLVRLSNSKEMVAYVPGEGHNLQEHNIVMVRVGRVQDLPGVKLKCIRGVYDLNHVVKRK